jgi:hypothetical protein
MLPFSLKESKNPLQVSQRGPYGEKYPLRGHFYLSLKISLFIFPSESPVREPLLVPQQGPHGQRYSVTRVTGLLFIHSFIHSFMFVCRSPQQEPSNIRMGKKQKVTIHGAPRRRNAYMQWGVAWFPKEIVTPLLSPPQCNAAFGTIHSTLAWVDQSPVSQRVW